MTEKQMLSLIESPITMFSPPEEIEAWIEECRRMQKERPDDASWDIALESALFELEWSRKFHRRSKRDKP